MVLHRPVELAGLLGNWPDESNPYARHPFHFDDDAGILTFPSMNDGFECDERRAIGVFRASTFLN
jgi:hypothetical protein